MIPSEGWSKALQYSCSFDKYASEEGLKPSKDFTLKFMVDDITNKAVLVGNNGISDVHIIAGNSGVTFLEPLNTGVVQSTTIVKQTGQAVHSRHTIIGNDLVASQYYGLCLQEF